jgi:AAA+ ATPase superfamily predicted ATPase
MIGTFSVIGDMMSKFSIDYSRLVNQITKKAYRLVDVKDQLETVAFDVVRFKDADKGAELWEVQSSDDGDYIVALYDEDETTTKTSSNWSVTLVKTAGSIQVSYKGDPIVCLASSKLGIPHEELCKVPQYLPEKLASNKKLVKALLNELTAESKQAVLKKYPELA